MTFPKDFLWGGAVTAHQSEGQEYAQMVLTLVKKVCNSMMILLIQ